MFIIWIGFIIEPIKCHIQANTYNLKGYFTPKFKFHPFATHHYVIVDSGDISEIMCPFWSFTEGENSTRWKQTMEAHIRFFTRV